MAIPSVETLVKVHGFTTRSAAKTAHKTMAKAVSEGRSPGGPSKYVKATGKVKKVKVAKKKPASRK